MRITGGTAAGLSLKVPKGFDVRPTADLVKQALFNSLGGRVIEARVLELFAGTGALGLECLSRGALSLICVEKTSRHARVIEENLQTTRLDAEKFELRIQDAFAAVAQLAAAELQFDVIIADPPYGDKNVGRRSTSFAQQLLDDAQLPKLIAPKGLFVLGHARRDTLSTSSAWREIKMLKHGDSILRFFKTTDHSETSQA